MSLFWICCLLVALLLRLSSEQWQGIASLPPDMGARLLYSDVCGSGKSRADLGYNEWSDPFQLPGAPGPDWRTLVVATWERYRVVEPRQYPHLATRDRKFLAQIQHANHTFTNS
jgi:hypothetical protein